MNPSTIYRIEAAVRRTRLSTLQRIAEALVGTAPSMGDARGLQPTWRRWPGLGWLLKASTRTGYKGVGKSENGDSREM